MRDCAKDNHCDAQLTLALEYANGNLGGVTKSQVAEFITQVNHHHHLILHIHPSAVMIAFERLHFLNNNNNNKKKKKKKKNL